METQENISAEVNEVNDGTAIVTEQEKVEPVLKSREEVRTERDFMKWKREAKDSQEREQILLKQLEAKEQEQMVSQQKYKELWENAQQKAQSLEEKNKELQSTFFDNFKLQEIEKQAIGMGIRKEALEDLRLKDHSGVITETTSTGSINILGAKDFVDKVKSERPYWFKNDGPPVVNNSVPGYEEPKKMAASDLLKLEKENPAKYREEILRRAKLK